MSVATQWDLRCVKKALVRHCLGTVGGQKLKVVYSVCRVSSTQWVPNLVRMGVSFGETLPFLVTFKYVKVTY